MDEHDGADNRWPAAYLNLGADESTRQANLAAAGLQVVAPVLLPEPGTPGGELLAPGRDRHFGWPVAAMAGDTLVVAVQVGGSGVHLVRSPDGGESWLPPVALGVFDRHPEANGPGMCALGATAEGGLVLACRRGIFTSRDAGASWEHRAVRLWDEADAGNAGPRILDDPRYGLILPVARMASPAWPGGTCLFVSSDGGASWRAERPEMPAGLRPPEPTLFALDAGFGMFCRNHSGYADAGVRYQRKWCHFAQFAPHASTNTDRVGALTFTGGLTPIYARRMDTPDAIFNPVTGRIEAVVSTRNEGILGRERGSMTLALWSIDPAAFGRGETSWRFECVLLRTQGMFSGTPEPAGTPREGFHPAGSALDLARGVQHILIYAGNCSHIYGHGIQPKPRNPPASATGVFRVTRTLHTDLLSAQANAHDGLDAAFSLNEPFNSLDAWIVGGSPLALRPETKDAVHRECDPPRDSLPQTGAEGLRWLLRKPGYHGLHHVDAMLAGPVRIAFRLRIRQFGNNADSFGLGLMRGSVKHYLMLREDGIYQWTDPASAPVHARRLKLDQDWHTWEIENAFDRCDVFQDGVRVAAIAPMYEAALGRHDVPVTLFAVLRDPDDRVTLNLASITVSPLSAILILA